MLGHDREEDCYQVNTQVFYFLYSYNKTNILRVSSKSNYARNFSPEKLGVHT